MLASVEITYSQLSCYMMPRVETWDNLRQTKLCMMSSVEVSPDMGGIVCETHCDTYLLLMLFTKALHFIRRPKVIKYILCIAHVWWNNVSDTLDGIQRFVYDLLTKEITCRILSKWLHNKNSATSSSIYESNLWFCVRWKPSTLVWLYTALRSLALSRLAWKKNQLLYTALRSLALSPLVFGKIFNCFIQRWDHLRCEYSLVSCSTLPDYSHGTVACTGRPVKWVFLAGRGFPRPAPFLQRS